MTRIEELIADLPGNALECGGSEGGRLYQDYPWFPLTGLRAKRETTAARLAFLKFNCPWTNFNGKRVLDIGCANGALSIGMAMMNAKVNGIDWNEKDIAIARLAAEELGVPVHFTQNNIVYGVQGQWDCAVYLSVWKWVVRRYGLAKANETLRSVSDHCKIMVFESGLTGTGIDLEIGVTPDEVEEILWANTDYQSIKSVGFFPRDDQQVDREVWVCS